MSAISYFKHATAAIEKVQKTQLAAISSAADILTDAIVKDKSIFSFGASHSFILTEEMIYRTGGLMLINPIYPQGMNTLVRPMTLTSRLERVLGIGKELLDSSPIKEGDVLIIASTSGRNSIVIDMAMAAREKKVTVIGITSIAYTNAVNSRHPSRKKLVDLCDVVIDNCAPYGDAVVDVPGFSAKVAPVSSLTGIAVVNSLVAEVVDKLVKKGIQPPVFVSANIDGADERNAKLMKENHHRIHYMC